MKRLAVLCLALLAAATGARAQWLTKTYNLAPGWNGIWLSGDASYATVGDLFAAYPGIGEIWRWNPDPDRVQFSESPSTPTTTSDEWTVWKRNDPSEQVLQRLVGNSAYLINNTATTSTSVALKQLVRAPANTWLISGANFMGFPAAGSSATWPVLNTYFASFINGGVTGLPTGTKIYKYVGGGLNSTNPLQISPTSERLDPDKAYWFSLATVSNFYGALAYELPGSGALAFGRTLSSLTVGVTNRSTSNLTLTISLDPSESAPAGQPAISGGVPLTRRVFNSATNAYDETQVPATGASPAYTLAVPASGRANLDFGILRSALATNSANFYASILRIRDSAGLTDVRIPVSAQPATTAGLWVAQIKVTNVTSTQPNSGSTTSRPFPMNVIVHMDAGGTPRLLRQVFVGRLASTGNPLGLAVAESRILGAAASDIKPTRYYVPMMPAGSSAIVGTGSFASGSSTTWTVAHAHNDPVNPFVHSYHPDHDNLDARFAPLAAGKESYNVNRTCVFAFTANPPDGSSVAGWGSTVLGGTYNETLTGLNKVPLTVSGTFAMRRISEISDIDLTSP
ncbi:MAG: hypothetical protein RLZZ50_755 [Verrucomicrobiota bacterium]